MYHKLKSYDGWFLRYKARRVEFFVILGHFSPFDPPNNSINQNFEKMKKMPGDIIILHLCTTNDNHVMYGSWYMEHGRIFCRFGYFLAFKTTNRPKNQNFEKWKKRQGISSFYTCAAEIMITWCTVPEIWCTTDGRTDRRTDGRTEKVTYRGEPKKTVKSLVVYQDQIKKL